MKKMSSLDLPSEYDVVVLGTGMTESIIAAALSRAGMSVLHLDRYDYYSGDWACFHFQGFQDWVKAKQDISASEPIEVKSFPETLLGEGETVVNLSVNSNTIKNVEQKIYIREDFEPSGGDTLNEPVNSDLSMVEESALQATDKSLTQQESGDPVQASVASSSVQTLGDDEVVSEEQQVSQTVGESTLTNKDDKKAVENECQASKETVSKDKEVTESEQKTAESRKTWVFSEIRKLWRKFNIDLMPKVLFCRGPMVELLISSDVAKYCEFKTVSKVLTLLNGKLEQVPCSRSDVFGSKLVSMIEKRMMMKYLTFCSEYEKHEENYIDFKDKPYKEYLQSQKLTTNIKHFIQHSIAMVTDEASTIEGLKATQTFVQSLGRYGNTAFLWPMYGSGELPQCFCRMCAVFGGLYCLRRTGQALVVDTENRCQAVIDTEGQKLNTKWLIVEASFASDTLLSSPITSSYTCRAVLVTDRSLSSESNEHITLLSLPVQGLPSPVSLLELPPSASCSPEGLYLVHLTCVCKQGAEQDLKPVIEDLFVTADQEDTLLTDCIKPRIQWAVYFEVADTTQCTNHPDSPTNVYVVGGPNHCLDFHYSINKAKEIFSEICPDQEFLPKAPNPEDIIWEGDGGDNQTTGGGFGEEGGSSAPGETENPDKSEAANVQTENTAEVTECIEGLSESKEVEIAKCKEEQSESSDRKEVEFTECKEGQSESKEVDVTKCKEGQNESEEVEVFECKEKQSENREVEVTECKDGQSESKEVEVTECKEGQSEK